jgi:hypothetical protein
VPFVVIQMIMVAIVIAFPEIVTSSLDKQAVVDIDQVQIVVPDDGGEKLDFGTPPDAADPAAAQEKSLEQLFKDTK